MNGELFFKTLNADGTPAYNGKGIWKLPSNNEDGSWTPGEWMPELQNLLPCKRGYHLCRPKGLVYWLAPMICVAEYRGKRIDCETKIVVTQARLLSICESWNEQTSRLFAADCAEHVLHFFEDILPADDRPRKVIEAARLFASNKITHDELLIAAWAADSAARAAASAARAAARDAVRAADSAASAAARDAVRAAAWTAASAARTAASAARTAASAASAAARDAVRAAAWAAAWAVRAAAWTAASDAGTAASDEREWQTKLLLSILEANL